MVVKKINLASTRLAFFLIALVVFQIFVSAVVPQRDLAVGQIVGWRNVLGPDNPLITRLWLDRIYYSPVFVVSLAVMGINLLLGNIQRFKAVLRVEKTLFRARHLGSIVFHLAILLVIAGVLLNNLYRFTGVYGLTEGQSVRDVPADYMRQDKGLLRGDESGRFTLKLEQVNRFREVGDAVTEEALVRLMPSDGGLPVSEGIRINRPLRWQGLEMHLGGATGYSPELLVLDPTGRLRFRSFIRLKVKKGPGGDVHEDYILLEEGRLSIRIQVIPDREDPLRQDRRLTISRGDALLFEGFLASADTLDAGGLRITIPRMRNWCYLHVMGNPLLWLVFAGFWVGLAGLTITVVVRVLSGRKRSL